MEKDLNRSCDCRTAVAPSNAEETPSFCDKGHYACDKFTDPAWIKINIDYFPAGFSAPKGNFKDISPAEAYKMLREQDGNRIVLDVKTEQEHHDKHLPDSHNLDFFSPTFKDDLFRLDKDRSYVVICKIGMRSEITMNLMKKMGFKEVYNVVGGDERWDAEELPYQDVCRNVNSTESV